MFIKHIRCSKFCRVQCVRHENILSVYILSALALSRHFTLVSQRTPYPDASHTTSPDAIACRCVQRVSSYR